MQSSNQHYTYLPCDTGLFFQGTHVLFLSCAFIFVLLRGLGCSGRMLGLEVLDLSYWRYINEQYAETWGGPMALLGSSANPHSQECRVSVKEISQLQDRPQHASMGISCSTEALYSPLRKRRHQREFLPPPSTPLTPVTARTEKDVLGTQKLLPATYWAKPQGKRWCSLCSTVSIPHVNEQ